MGSLWHIGFAVPDLQESQEEFGEVFGLRWRPARVRRLTLADAAGRPYEVECHVIFSLGGPFAIEVWQAIPGTPLELCDLHSDRPSLRDLFPSGSEFAGEPLAGSAL